MRTTRPPYSAPLREAKRNGSTEGHLSSQVEAYVESARKLEFMALDLAQRNVEETSAVPCLIKAAKGDALVIRRAHRHCERAVSEQWPAGVSLIRAFDYLSAARRELEIEGPQCADGIAQASAEDKEDGEGARLEKVIYDLVDEAGMESFPASDAPSFWAR